MAAEFNLTVFTQRNEKSLRDAGFNQPTQK
jgi:hypothetical protein